MTHQNKEGLEALAMTPEEVRMEDLKQMAAYSGPIVSLDALDPYYLASCDKCGWIGSSERCGADAFGDDSDVYCPRCFASGADCGMVADAISSLREENERLRKALEKVDAIRNSIIGFQNVGWSDHIYPLVAALEDAGFNGKGYDVMRTEIRTMLEAERQLSASQAQLNTYREALEPFAEWVDAMEANEFLSGSRFSHWSDDYHPVDTLPLSAFRRARTALSQNQEQSE